MITTFTYKKHRNNRRINNRFNKGLNVLTGETGAGKTLIIDSLSILSGGRFSKRNDKKR